MVCWWSDVFQSYTSHTARRHSCWLVVCEEHCDVSIELSGCGEAWLSGVESSEVLFSCEILMCRRPLGQWAAGRHQSRADLASWPPIGGQGGAMGSDHRPLGPRSANQGRGSGGCGPMAGRDQCPRPILRAAGRVNTADQGTMSLGPPLGCFSRRRSCARIWLSIAEEVLLRKEQSTMVTFIF